MNRLYKYMDARNIDYRGATFGSDYFTNAAPVKFVGAFVTVSYADTRGKAWKDFRRFCERWTYDLRRESGYNGIEVFSACRADDAEALRLYDRYRMASTNAVDMAIHDRHTGAAHTDMTDAAFNDYLRGIMDEYGEQYNTEAGRRAEQEASA